MSKSINIDKAGECLRNILDNNRCGLCDKLGRTYWRCSYGHIACDECTVNDDGCLTCFTTFNSPVLNNTWVIDNSQTQKTKNSLDLLNTFQDTFKTDVYKRQRISDQLKAERELFPDCIQAPVKYTNKRKAVKSYSSLYKENSQQSCYPGEDITPLQTPKMEKSKYVQQWLDNGKTTTKKTSSRKPFSNINENNKNLSSIHGKIMKDKPSFKSSVAKNSTLNKTTRSKYKKVSRSEKVSHENFIKNTDAKKQNKIKTYLPLDKSKVNKQDDSGIGIDEECITIEDSQSEIIDKDELALQAVREAEMNECSDYNSMIDESVNQSKVNGNVVPFVQKSLLYVSCSNCNKDVKTQDSIQEKYANNISITIEYGANEANVCKQSISVQTEISELDKNSITTTNNEEDDVLNDNNKIGSQDLFTNDILDATETVSSSKDKVLIIDESDTDNETEHLQVAAEVHRTCEQKDYDILTELDHSEMLNRKGRAKRGATPGSTDSSEKENFDPNRVKRTKFMRKGKKKPNKY